VTDPNPGFFARLALSFAAFFRVLFDASYAGRVARLGAGEAPSAPPPEAPAVKLHVAPTESALQLLGLLQREGRLIDFLQEEVSGFSDAEIGAAARVLHDSLKKALSEHVTLARVRSESEGARISVPKGFSASELRLVGNVVGEPPFSGTLNHAGWRATRIELPKLSEGHDVHVLAPAEVEL
jgi:hypothetical protein